MTRLRCTTPAGSRGGLRVRRGAAELVGEGVRGRVFVCGADSDAEGLVRVRAMPAGAASGLCDSGCGIAPGAVVDGGAAAGDCAPAARMRSERKAMDGKGGG